jgi:hypothetical protein
VNRKTRLLEGYIRKYAEREAGQLKKRFFRCLQCSSGGGSGITSNTILISINSYIISIRKFLHKITLGKTMLM